MRGDALDGASVIKGGRRRFDHRARGQLVGMAPRFNRTFRETGETHYSWREPARLDNTRPAVIGLFLMPEGESFLGKSGDAMQAWFRTLVLMFRDRRALLIDAPLSPDRSLSPIAFMFAGAAAFGVVHAMIGLKAPEMELPEAASLLQQ
ncbi:MAG: hypothetical protein JOZ42_00225, partial [Acetobacteraceae bacterium]|nr:hypothetical protein [Acetobacteraceae bacterium]